MIQPKSVLLLQRALLKRKWQAAKDEQGIALVMSLMIGLVLIAAATGLLVRQLTARKLGAAESYQQLAEDAANNGFNRILAVLNKRSAPAGPDEYRGYLFTIDNKKDGNDPSRNFEWEQANAVDDICSNKTLPATTLEPADEQWPRNESGYALNANSMREDNKGTIKTRYQLESYNASPDFEAGSGEISGTGTFVVKAWVDREDPNGVSKRMAQVRLTRRLQLESKVSQPQSSDWAVLASSATNPATQAGTITITGPGLYHWNVNTGDLQTALQTCNGQNSLPNINSNESNRFWPMQNRVNVNRRLPDTAAIYQADGTFDSFENDPTIRRIWSFDDTQLAGENPGIICGSGGSRSIVCSRDLGSTSSTSNIPLESTQIQTSAASTNTASNEPTTNIQYKTFKKKKINDIKHVKIGTCDRPDKDNDCRSRQDKGTSGNWDWSNWRTDPSGSDIKVWRWKPRSNETIRQQGTCTRTHAIHCAHDGDNWNWVDEVSTNPPSQEGTTATADTIKIRSSDICSSSPDSNVCHLYVEHLNLTKTKLYIENDNNRPVVLRFYIPPQDYRRTFNGASNQFKLGTNSKLCGVDSTDADTPTCNQQPQQLVITAESSCQDGSPCGDDYNVPAGTVFTFSGVSLPAAWVSLITGNSQLNKIATQGSVNLIGNVSMHGVIWANGLTSNGSLALSTQDSNGSAYVDQAQTLWGTPFKFFGRENIRVNGVRGTVYDIFRAY